MRKKSKEEMDISTNYMGLKLSSPIIAGSCGLTSSIDNLLKMEEYGVGAIVLPSIFEEQITLTTNKTPKSSSYYGTYEESFSYLSSRTNEDTLHKYLSLIRTAKSQLKIPVIASINCISYSEWISFAKQIEEAGADAIEINISIFPSDINLSHEDVELLFSNIISALKKIITIPVAIKTGCYFTEMSKFMQRISWMGIKGLVLFNRFVTPDIDINTFSYKQTNRFTSKEEFFNTLRWTAILSDLLRCDLSASSGIKVGSDVIKLLLAGAQSVQVVSCLYEKGIEHIGTMIEELEQWMFEHNYSSISDFRGKMSLPSHEHPASVLRILFMKYFSGIE